MQKDSCEKLAGIKGWRIEPRTYQEGSNDRVVRGFTFPPKLKTQYRRIYLG